jgi:hypothetical protein
VQELFSEELLVALPPGHPLTRKRTLDGARLIVMNEGHCLGDQVLGFCDLHDLNHHISFRSAQLETINPWYEPDWASRSSQRWPRDETALMGQRIVHCAHLNQVVKSSPSGPLNVRSVEQRVSLLRQSRRAFRKT